MYVVKKLYQYNSSEIMLIAFICRLLKNVLYLKSRV